MYGDKAIQLLKELQQHQWLPMYNDETIKQILSDMNKIYKEIVTNISYGNNFFSDHLVIQNMKPMIHTWQ